jgi:hypothetical protein
MLAGRLRGYVEKIRHDGRIEAMDGLYGYGASRSGLFRARS